MKCVLKSNKDIEVLVSPVTYMLFKHKKINISSDGYATVDCDFLTHLILGKPPVGHVVDHINGQKLDNTLENLRIVTYKINAYNKSTPIHGTSRYRSVCFRASRNTWRVQVASKDRGSYKSELHAAYAANLAMIEEYGNYANLNLDVLDEPADFILSKSPQTRDLPPNVHIDQKEQYYIKLQVAGVLHKSQSFVTIDEALAELVIMKSKFRESEVDLPVQRNDEGIAIISVCDGRCHVKVSDEDYDRLSKYSFSLNKKGYPECGQGRIHHMVMQCEANTTIDHINRDKLDARRENLRIASASQNAQNKNTSNPLGYVGVKELYKKYLVRISFERIRYSLGSYSDILVAAWVYNQIALKFYGPIGTYLNDVPDQPDWKLIEYRTRNGCKAYKAVQKEIVIDRNELGQARLPVSSKDKQIQCYTILDDEDYLKYYGHSWYRHNNVIESSIGLLHRLICPNSQTVHHLNGDIFDNRRSNLEGRAGTRSNESTIRGIYLSRNKKYSPRLIGNDNQQYNLGTYEDINVAKWTYNQAGKHLDIHKFEPHTHEEIDGWKFETKIEKGKKRLYSVRED